MLGERCVGRVSSESSPSAGQEHIVSRATLDPQGASRTTSPACVIQNRPPLVNGSASIVSIDNVVKSSGG